MRILYLTQWYWPEPAKLQGDIATGLREQGHDVTVLTGYPNYPEGKLYDGYRIRPWQKEVFDGMPVIRMPLYCDHSRSAWRRAWNHASLSLATLCLAPWVVPEFDLLYGARPITLGLPAWWLSRLRRKPFVLEIADMWPEALADTGMLTRPSAVAAIKHYSNWVCRRAAAVRVDTPGFRENLIAKGILPSKIHFIPDWVDTDLYQPKPPNAALAAELGLAGRFNVMFAGNMGLTQGLASVIEAASRLGDLPQIQFVFGGGFGVERERLQAMAIERGLDNVKFLPYFPYEMLSDVYALADVLLVQLRDTPLARITIPHKIYAYMAVGKPILAAIVGDTAAAIERVGAGIACPPCDPAALVAAVRRLVEMPASAREEMGRCGRQAACETYSVKVVTARLARLLEAVAAGQDAGV